MSETQPEQKENQDEKLAFPEAVIVRILKKHLDKEKMIKKEVKIAMNKWLEKIASNVAKEMNKFPYVMVSLNEFKEAVRVYENMEEFNKEKERIFAHLEAMKRDIERLQKDLGVVEEEVVKL